MHPSKSQSETDINDQVHCAKVDEDIPGPWGHVYMCVCVDRD